MKKKKKGGGGEEVGDGEEGEKEECVHSVFHF